MAGIQALVDYRREHGLTQQQLGDRLGVTDATIQRWENGSRAPLKRRIPRISEVTGISPVRLLGLEAAAK